jgi:CheY-like chemotaxis protein
METLLNKAFYSKTTESHMKNLKHQASQKFYNPNIFSKLVTYENQFPEIDAGHEITPRKKKKLKLFISQPQVLLVEDSLMLQSVFEDMLNFLGCRVDIAEDGYEAVTMANKKTYDVIFMDIGLPRLDGIGATKIIRNQEPRQHRNIIVALTAYGDTVAKECEDAGVNDFYTKPVLLDDLKRILTYWLPHLVNPTTSSLN